jgi:polyisoprenoid-binding protein YceI
MKALILIAAPALFALAAPAAAQSGFDGIWKVDPATAQFGAASQHRVI